MQKTVAVMCMLHKRHPASLKAIRSLAGQVDTLYLCLSDFQEIPQELNQNWIEIMYSGTGLTDSDARCLRLLKDKGENTHVLFCDDNLIYPPSYVEDFLVANARLPDTVLTHHGYTAYYPEPDTVHFHKVMGYRGDYEKPVSLDVSGAGTLFIPEAVFNRMQFADPPCVDQADIQVACNCLKLNIPIIGLPHQARYFGTINSNDRSDWVNHHTLNHKMDWMDKARQTYQFYGLSMAALYAREKPEPAPEFKVTTVLSAYRRVENLAEQIQALRNQTVSTDIWVDYTVPEGEETVDILNIAPGVKLTVHTNQNVNYMRRFYNALNAPTEYVFICDDDIIPGKNYIQHCLDTMEQIGDCVLVGYGIRFKSGARDYHKRNRVPHGWFIDPDQMQKHPIHVDMGGQSWFFRKKHLACIAREDPLTRLTGEDLHFSYCLQKYAGISIYVPPHVAGEYDNWSCQYERGVECGRNHASNVQPGFHSMRSRIVAHYVDRGWRFVDDEEPADQESGA